MMTPSDTQRHRLLQRPSYASPHHRALAESAYAASLRLPALPGVEVAIVGMLVGEARRLGDGRPVDIEALDVLAEDLQAAHQRTGLSEIRALHDAVVALAVEMDRQQRPAPASFISAGRRGPGGL